MSSSSGWRRAASRAHGPSQRRRRPGAGAEEERRLAYVAWTRARRTLTLLYDPARPVAVPARGVQPRRARPRRRLSAAAASPVASRQSRAGRSRRGTARSPRPAGRRGSESFGPYAARARIAVERRAAGSSSRSRSGSGSRYVDPARRRRARAPRRAAGRRGGPRPAPASSMAGQLVAGRAPAVRGARAQASRRGRGGPIGSGRAVRRRERAAAAAACAPSR